MTLPIRTLKIQQRWDCHGCTACCRGTLIELDDKDLKRLGDQAWEKHPDYRDVQVIERRGLWKRTFRLAKREDGSCIFLLPDGRCSIHTNHGADAKPLICRMFPFQVVPLAEFAHLTLRRSCPSAAAGRGRELKEHRHGVRKLIERGRLAPKPTRPPPIVPRHQRSWKETLRVCDVIERLMLDERYPLVRRIVHGLQFCGLLAECRLKKIESGDLAELLGILEDSATEGVGELFRSRVCPGRTTQLLFRRAALDYLRLHPKNVVERSWPARWRWIRATVAMVRGKGAFPQLSPGFPCTTFEALESPLGHLDHDVLRPLAAYFEVSAASKQYAILGRRGWSVVESFRAFALSHAIALWMLRLHAGDSTPEIQHTTDVVAALDRGQDFGPLASSGHRSRVARIGRLGELPRLVAWYAR